MKINSKHLQHTKSFRLKPGIGAPRNTEGADGDLVLRVIKGGLRLFAKYGGRWYVVGGDSLREPSGSQISNTRNAGGNRGSIGDLARNDSKARFRVLTLPVAEPKDPANGAVYWDKDNANLKIYIKDPSGSGWTNALTGQSTNAVVTSINMTSSTNSLTPEINMKNTYATGSLADANAPKIILSRMPGQGTGTGFLTADDYVGQIYFVGTTTGSATENIYASILAVIGDPVHADMEGILKLGVVSNGAGQTTHGLILTGTDVTAQVDVTIGAGAGSTTTAAGNLIATGDLTVNGNNIDFDAGNSTLSVGPRSGDTNADGYRLIFEAGQSTGSAAGGTIYFKSSDGGISGTTVRAQVSQVGIRGSTSAVGTGFLGLKAVNKLHFDGVDGTGDTYIKESGADILDIYVGGDLALSLDENTGYADINGSWILRSGFHGYSNTIKILPRDFIANDDRAGTSPWDDDGGGLRVSHALEELFAFVTIPAGYKATHYGVSASATLNTECLESAIDTAYTSAVSKGSGNTGGTIAITNVDAGDKNYLVIRVDTTATTEYIYGGFVTIARIT